MASFNKVILVGNLTRDPELRYSPKGVAIAKLGLAVNRRWTNEQGEVREETTFVDIDAFGKQAETLATYCKKGRALLVEGRLKLDQWDDKSGQKRTKLGVVLEGFSFLDSLRSEPAPAPAAEPTRQPSAAASPPLPEPPPPEREGPPPEDDVPF